MYGSSAVYRIEMTYALNVFGLFRICFNADDSI